MLRWSALPRPVLATLAGAFAFIAILYSGLWMYDLRYSGPLVPVGFNAVHSPRYNPTTHSLNVEDVVRGSPADQAGLRAGDRIIAVNGKPLGADTSPDAPYVVGHPGDAVALTVERAGQSQPLILHGFFEGKRLPTTAGGRVARFSLLQVIGAFPIPFLLVGFSVLFLKLEEPTAWLLALLLCAFVGAPDFFNLWAFHPALRAFALAFRAVSLGMLFPLFYLFFALFPRRSPLDLRWPWLKWVGLALGVCIVVPGLRTGHPSFAQVIARLMGNRATDAMLSFLFYSFLTLGLISLAQNSFRTSVPSEARRKSLVILWGTVVGVLPIAIERLAVDFAGYNPPFWLETLLVLVLSLFPLSFAYAVVKHRVMDVPVLLRRSARYVFVQRGFFVLLFIAGAVTIAIFTNIFSRFFQEGSNAAMMLSAAFGIALVWFSAPLVKRGTQRIDRAFFRSSYDARVILEDLAEKARTVTSRRELATLLEKHIVGAIQPESFACYFKGSDGSFALQCAQPAVPQAFPPIVRLTTEPLRHSKSFDLPRPDADGPGKWKDLAPFAPECLVPILGRTGDLIGLVVLGARLSEEPYSGEDRRLLDSVAGQVGMTLENIQLVEIMAERLEADRRVAREMEIAREVQARLFPQKIPVVKTLEFMGSCFPARAVGGDYYDFLELREGRVALILADIAGKGVSGALLMANLQASLRSQCAMPIDDLRRLLVSVNRSFCQNTGEASFATLFFADYDDSSRRLRYVNCGHLPPLLIGASETSSSEVSAKRKVEWLSATSTVVGMFEAWECEIAEVALTPGDTLVLYTDGITEARSAEGEEFGESRLLDTLKCHCHLAVEPLLQKVVGAVRQFTSGEQEDDITLVIARSLK
jgi:phosphoserine phosphatase RsbU/P